MYIMRVCFCWKVIKYSRLAKFRIPWLYSLLWDETPNLENLRSVEYRLITVGFHLLFQHNELFHLPYMAVAEISLDG